MATVNDILEKKGTHVYTIQSNATVREAVLLMNDHKIGALVVLNRENKIAGMFTERDVLKRIVVEQRDPSQTSVNDVMTHEISCCATHTALDEARAAMKNRRIRHLPVVDAEGHILGMISIGDLNAFDTANQEQEIFLLNEYMHGRV